MLICWTIDTDWDSQNKNLFVSFFRIWKGHGWSSPHLFKREVDKNGHINMIWVAMIWVHSDHWYECTNMSDGTQSAKIIDISGLSEWYYKYHLLFVFILVFLLISLKYECPNSYHCKLRLILVLLKSQISL